MNKRGYLLYCYNTFSDVIIRHSDVIIGLHKTIPTLKQEFISLPNEPDSATPNQKRFEKLLEILKQAKSTKRRRKQRENQCFLMFFFFFFEGEKCLVFVNTVQMAKEAQEFLSAHQIPIKGIHKGKPLHTIISKYGNRKYSLANCFLFSRSGNYGATDKSAAVPIGTDLRVDLYGFGSTRSRYSADRHDHPVGVSAERGRLSPSHWKNCANGRLGKRY